MRNKQKCRNASRYKAKFEPKCGCVACWDKWNYRPKVDKNVEAMRKASGNVTSDDLMVGLFYILLRDVVSPGKIEAILLELSNAHDYKTTKNPKFRFTNGWIANYAKNIVQRLKKNMKTKDDINDPNFSTRIRSYRG